MERECLKPKAIVNVHANRSLVVAASIEGSQQSTGNDISVR